jgi:hypothetical protein
MGLPQAELQSIERVDSVVIRNGRRFISNAYSRPLLAGKAAMCA